MTCPDCHTSEIYRTRLVREYSGEDTVQSELVRPTGKYDNPETGEFECVNGHAFEVEPEEEPQIKTI